MADAAQEDFSQLPLPDRFTHKNWKVRKEGYEAAAKQFEVTPDEADPAFKPFLQDSGLLKDAVGDSNVAAQQEGLLALCAFLKYGGPLAASRTKSLTLEPIREKGLSSTRPAAKAAALEAVLLYVEIDKPDFVVEELLPALSHKQPKVIAATLSAITLVFHNFGCKVLDPKPVLKTLPKVFGHADKNVRAEATNLTAELYRWLKEAIKAVFWNDLKPVQQQDLEKLFEKIKEEPPPKQERLTRAQQAAAAVAEDNGAQDVGDGEAEDNEADQPVEIEAFDLTDPVDVFPKIPKDLHEKLASSKWKERKDALDDLFTIVNVPRIKDGHYHEIIGDMAKIILKDANVTVVATAANCVEKLALGIRKGFGKYRSNILSPMLERCKEKKQAVADALGAALDAVFGATSLSDCLEETLGFLPHKNPQVKLETVKFLTRCLRSTRDVPAKTEVKSIADAATKLLTESTEVMRSGGAEILGTLMKIMGERAMGPYLDGLDDIRKAKIKEYFDAAVVKAKDRPKPIAPPAKVAATSALGKKVTGKKPSGVKKPAPPPPEEEPAPVKAQPTARSLARPGLSKPGSGLSAPTSTGSKLNALKKPTSGLASPARRVISPSTNPDDNDSTPAPSPAKFSQANRGGLAGRSLSRPTPSQTEPIPKSPPTSRSSTLTALERSELDELRAEKDRLSQLSDTLRSSNSKLYSEISELQNQNAQLIEDHTRDVLQIKAKETQLVRARGECDVLRSELDTARKDIERQKREMSRLGRESLGREQLQQQQQQQQRDPTIGLGLVAGLASPTPKDSDGGGGGANSSNSHHSSSSTTTTNGRPPPSSRTTTATSTYRDRFDLPSPSEDDEKTTTDAMAPLFPSSRRKISPLSSGYDAHSGSGSGATSPQRTHPTTTATTTSSSNPSRTAIDRDLSSSRARSPPESAENWKRAAEVTSQLKARIEQMKARQGFSRPPH